MHTIKLKIADTTIKMQSRFPLKAYPEGGQESQAPERFRSFFSKPDKRHDILIAVEVVDKLPKIKGARSIFITRHFEDGNENWRLLKKGNTLIYESLLEPKKQQMLINSRFDRVRAFLEAEENKPKAWGVGSIIYDFLQVLLMNYFAQRNSGLFTHAVGIKDLDGRGFLFAGKSGAGKSTSARLWYKHSRAMVLNDDRIIARKLKGKFFIHGSPWHGTFSDYLASRIESAPLKKLFFIHHAPKNNVRKISEKEAFNSLYPAIFPTFWDKAGLENIVCFCEELVSRVPCYSLGFVKNKSIIEFVRNVQ